MLPDPRYLRDAELVAAADTEMSEAIMSPGDGFRLEVRAGIRMGSAELYINVVVARLLRSAVHQSRAFPSFPDPVLNGISLDSVLLVPHKCTCTEHCIRGVPGEDQARHAVAEAFL